MRVALLVAAALAVGGCKTGYDRMIDQHRYDAFEKNPFFPDGATLQHPPEGTVPRGEVLGPPELVTGRVDGNYATEIPIRVTQTVLDRGRDRFEIFCATCHGMVGDGRSRVADMMKLRRPPSLHEARIRAYPVGRIFAIATEGYGFMPSYRSRIDVRDRWAVVAYVRVLQLSQHATLANLPADIRVEAEEQLHD